MTRQQIPSSHLKNGKETVVNAVGGISGWEVGTGDTLRKEVGDKSQRAGKALLKIDSLSSGKKHD